MLIHNLVATGSISYNGVNISYVTGSQTSLDGLNQFSASVNTTTGSLNSTTGSLNTATGSLFTASGSFSTRVTNIEGNYATTGSNVFLGAQTVCANITSTGTIIAQTLNVQQVTSSIVYSSGSNIFGCLTTDVQQMTGSLRVTGSGVHYIQGGCVGIGTSNPLSSLHISSQLPYIYLTDTSTSGTRPTARIVVGDVGTCQALTIGFSCNDGNTCNNEILTVTELGNVGINTATPQAPLTIKSSGATGILMSCDPSNPAVSSRLFFQSCQNQFAILNSGGALAFTYAASLPASSGNVGMRMSTDGIVFLSCQLCTPHLVASNNISIGSNCTSTDGYNTRLRITNIQNDTFVFAFNNQACKAIMYMYGGNINNPQGYTAWLDNTSGQTNHLISHNSAEATYFAAKGGFVGIGATTPCSLLNVNCVSNGGDSLYTNMFSITTDVSSVYNHLALSPTAIEYRRNTSTGVDLCIMTKVCNGSNGGNIVFAPNLDGASFCSFPRMKIQQNGFIGIGAYCAGTYLHVCDNLSAGRDDLIRLQTTISTNHAWMKSISCAGVTSIFGSNRANTDGNLLANHAVAGTTSAHNFDLISNSTVRVRLASGGAVCLLGNSNDYPTLILAGPTYNLVAMGDRSSSAGTDVGYISISNQGTRVIDLPGNSDPVVFANGGPMIAGRQYANGDSSFGYQFLEICNGQTYHGPLSLGNSGGGVALTPLYCSGGKRWGFGWNTAEMNNMTVYNNCSPILINWGVNGDNPTTDRKFCFNYSGNAYASGGTWGTLSSNCVIKTCIVGANSQWSDVKNICIVNYKMKEEIEEFGDSARIHLGVVAEQVAQVSPGLLDEGGYSEKWCTCLNGVKTSILYMKAIKALQEAMCKIEILESCLGIN